MSDLQEVIDQLNLDHAITYTDPQDPILDTVSEIELAPEINNYSVYLTKFGQVCGALAVAELLTLISYGIASSSLMPNVAKPIASFFHGMSCGIGKNLIMSILAEDFKSCEATLKLESFLAGYMKEDLAKYISKECAITVLSFIAAGLNDGRSGINKVFISDSTADLMDLNPPPFDKYYNRLIELVIGRVVKDYVFKSLSESDLRVLTEQTIVPSVLADLAKMYAKEMWKRGDIFGANFDEIFSLKKFAYNFGCALTKPFASFLYRDYIKPTLIGDPNSEDPSSWKKFFDSVLSTTTSSVCFTVMAKWLKSYM